MSLLGGDRQASRNELRKLALYAHGKGEVTLDDVMAVVADASELKIDPIVDGAFAGQAGSGRNRIHQGDGRRHLSGHDHIGGAAPGGVAAQGQRLRWPRARRSSTPARERISAAAFFAQERGRDRAAQFQRGAAGRRSSSSSATPRWKRASSVAGAAIAQRALMAIAVNARRRG